MKIDAALREIYVSQRRDNIRLLELVEPTLKKAVKSRWHLEHRIKTDESFALKVETGRVSDPNRLEDFLGFLVVVPNLTDVQEAERQILDRFNLTTRRPPRTANTRKSSDSFAFDDLRLYVTRSPSDFSEPTRFDKIVFEIQIRTFLQHAWSVSTHDTVYKSDSVSWRRERISFQVRAVLEQAEMTTSSLLLLESTESLPQSSDNYDEINDIIRVLKLHWHPSLLPTDVKRLAETAQKLLKSVKCQYQQLDGLLSRGRQSNGGDHNLDWSPYRSILHYISVEFGTELRSYLAKKPGRNNPSIYLTQEVLEAIGIDNIKALSAIVADPGQS